MASDSSMRPGVDSASKNEYQVNLGGKCGRCIRLTTYHIHVPIVKKSGSLNLLEHCGPVQACNGAVLPSTGSRVVSNFGIPWGGYRFWGIVTRNFVIIN